MADDSKTIIQLKSHSLEVLFIASKIFLVGRFFAIFLKFRLCDILSLPFFWPKITQRGLLFMGI